MFNIYLRIIELLNETGFATKKCFGNSMTPIIKSGSTLTFEKCEEYDIGDIVFCKVKGRYYDAHIVTKKSDDGRFLISNNHGHDNGWTNLSNIYGKVVDIKPPNS